MPAKQPHAADEFEAAFEQGLDILGMCDLKTSRVIAPGEIHPAAVAAARRKTAIAGLNRGFHGGADGNANREIVSGFGKMQTKVGDAAQGIWKKGCAKKKASVRGRAKTKNAGRKRPVVSQAKQPA